MTLRFTDDLGDLRAGTLLSFRVAGEPSARAYLPVEPVGAEVVAVDAQPPGPAQASGRQPAPSCSAPIRSSTWRRGPRRQSRVHLAPLFRAGHGGRRERPVRVDDPRVLVGRVRSGDSETALFVNCTADSIAAEPVLTGGRGWTPPGRWRRSRRSASPRSRRERGTARAHQEQL